MTAEIPVYKARRLIVPVNEDGIDNKKPMHSLGYNPSEDTFLLFSELKTPVEVSKFTEFRDKFTGLVQNLIKEEGTETTLYMYGDEKDREHGFHGWGFKVARKEGEFEILEGYSKHLRSENTYTKQEIESGNAWVYLGDLGSEKNIEELIGSSLKDGELYGLPYGVEMKHDDALIDLWNMGSVISFVNSLDRYKNEKGQIDHIYRGQRLLSFLNISGSEESVNKYLGMFEKSLGTAFIAPTPWETKK